MVTSKVTSAQQEAILEALAAERNGRGRNPIPLCPTCATPLKVLALPEIGRITVACDDGCTNAHFVCPVTP